MGIDSLIGKSSEASSGGFRAIKVLEGVFSDADRVPSKFKEEDSDHGVPKDQVQVVIEEVTILEMEPGEVEPDLTDDRFTFWMTYAPPGKPKPSRNTFFTKGFVKSAEDLWTARGQAGKGFKDLVGTRVTLEKQKVFLFKRDAKPSEEADAEEDGKIHIYQEGYVFVEGDSVDVTPINEYVKSLILGLKKPAATRRVLQDNRTKRDAKWKTAIGDGTIDELVGVKLGDKGYEEA